MSSDALPDDPETRLSPGRSPQEHVAARSSNSAPVDGGARVTDRGIDAGILPVVSDDGIVERKRRSAPTFPRHMG
jgi:hypothetical protein